MTTLRRDRMLYAAAYAAALAAGAAVAYLWPSSLWWRSMAGAAAATVVLYACSVAFDNSGFYDVYWSLAPIVLGVAWLAAGGGSSRLRAFAAVALTAAWGLRLTWNWASHWQGLAREDWRYADLRRKTGRGYWPASFFALHVYPMVMVALGTWPLYLAVTAGARPFDWLDAVAILVMSAGVIVEAAADAQLHRFVRHNRDPQRFLDRGLWALSRHPNYFGEALVWWGMWLFAVAADPRWWWTCLGALGVTAMITLISIPMADRRQAAKRSGYVGYVLRTSAFVPWPPRPPPAAQSSSYTSGRGRSADS
jgi:steroid 5-alpha reductase family enzyme